MKKIKYPENFYKFFLKKTKKTKKTSNNKNITSKNKKCKNFCKKVFIPEKERVEMKITKKNKMKYIKPSKFVKEIYLKGCNDIYCMEKCDGRKGKWLRTFSKKRKDKLIQQGAISGCRDLHKEFPEYYKNI